MGTRGGVFQWMGTREGRCVSVDGNKGRCGAVDGNKGGAVWFSGWEQSNSTTSDGRT